MTRLNWLALAASIILAATGAAAFERAMIAYNFAQLQEQEQ